MIIPLRQIGVILFFCCGVFLTFGQQERDLVHGMFDDSTDLEWVRHMEGTVSDAHPITLSLGFDGITYKGKLTIGDDSTSFDLIGVMDDQRLVLQEIDNNGLHTGYLIGALEDDRFIAQWWSRDMSRSKNIRLMESDLVVLKDFKPLMIKLEGMVGEEIFDCILMVESTGVISGIWQRNDECVRMIGKCGDELCAEIKLVVTEGELNNTDITFSLEDEKTFRVDVENESTPQYGSVTIVDEIVLNRQAKADYSFIIDFVYPDINDGNFNSWIEAKFLDWYTLTLRVFERNDKKGPEGRWSQTATGWSDVFLYTDQLVSGLITYYDPEGRNYKRENFIYSLDEERELKIAELAKKDRDLVVELQNEIHADGVNSNEFKYPVLTRSGFFMCTDFDAVEGDHSAMVRYETVEKVVKRKAFFTKLEQ